MHRRLVENSLSLFLALFLLTLAAQSAAGRRAFDAEQLIHDASPSRWAHSVTSSEFGQAVKENR